MSATYHRALYGTRKKQGLCVRCGEERGEGSTKVLCAGHAAQATAASAARRARFKVEGRCHDCGKVRGADSSASLCGDCLTLKWLRNQEMNERLMAEGLCLDCRKPRGERGTTRYCRPCANRRTAYVLARKRGMEGT